ncbi:hypothetical protein DFH08DRAFT_877933 [Mycena albidolilacea]|uniref:Uncharacterized protein n=1 Tax=Mycena albidolilacea TaxID=1033008 RepID=A0AAD6ZRB9_9AGAR|nr:hypothetical protein DFH08DRAFT_877933 [Mycena albidolilacea]
MPSPPTPIMQLTELTVGSLLYGTYLNLFLTSMYILVKRSRGAHTSPLHHSTMFVLGCTLFITVTANWIILIIINFNGFIFFEGGTAAPEYFAIPRLGIQAALWGTAIVSIILNDCMMIYRLWVVWERKKGIVVLPILTWVGLIVCSTLAAIDSWGKIVTAKIVIFIPIFVFIVMTNFYCTGLIAWKIWRITRICQPLNGTNLNHFLAMVIESSALYTAWALFFVVSQQETSILQYFSFGVHPMIAGIANALLQARIGMGKTVEPATSALTSIHFATRSTDAGPSAGEVSSRDVGMKPITL